MPAACGAGEFWESRDPPRRPGRLRALQPAAAAAARTPRSPTACSGSTASRGVLWDRARPRRDADGTRAGPGIISDVTLARGGGRAAGRGERALHAAARRRRRARLPRARASRTGGSRSSSRARAPTACSAAPSPDPEMENWEAAVHPEDRAGVRRASTRALAGGRGRATSSTASIGADGITRWVHDRAAAGAGRDGTVGDQRHRLRRHRAAAHARRAGPGARRAVAVVEAMDDHLYTLRVDPDGAYATVYRGPNREALAGGPLPDGADGDGRCESLVHPDDRARWRVARSRGSAAGEPIDARVPGGRPRRRASGSCSTSCAPRRDADGTLLLRRRHARHHRAPAARGRAAAHAVEMQDAHRELEGPARRPSCARAPTS